MTDYLEIGLCQIPYPDTGTRLSNHNQKVRRLTVSLRSISLRGTHLNHQGSFLCLLIGLIIILPFYGDSYGCKNCHHYNQASKKNSVFNLHTFLLKIKKLIYFSVLISSYLLV